MGNGNFISTPVFSHVAHPANTIILDPEESYAANCLRVNDYLLIARGFPKSKKKILELGYNIIELDMSEFRKIQAAALPASRCSSDMICRLRYANGWERFV